MPVLYTPCIISIQRPVETVDGATRTVYVPEYPYIANGLRCYIYPMSQSAVFDKYGVTLNRPHELMCDIGLSEFFTPGNWVKWGNRVFLMSTPPMIFEAGGPFSITDHLSVSLEELQYA